MKRDRWLPSVAAAAIFVASIAAGAGASSVTSPSFFVPTSGSTTQVETVGLASGTSFRDLKVRALSSAYTSGTSSNLLYAGYAGNPATSLRYAVCANGVPEFSDNGSLPYACSSSNSASIFGSDGNTIHRWYSANTSAFPGMYVQLGGSRGTTASPTTVVVGDVVGAYQGCGYIGPTSGHAVMGGFSVECDATPSDSVVAPGRVVFRTSMSSITGSAGTFYPQWCIDKDGFFKGRSGTLLGWVSSTSDPTGSVDVTASRQGAGVLQVGTTAANANGTLLAAKLATASTSVFVTSGSGSPEGSITASVGSIYQRTDGGSGTTIYMKESGVGNTGWTAINISGSTPSLSSVLSAGNAIGNSQTIDLSANAGSSGSPILSFTSGIGFYRSGTDIGVSGICRFTAAQFTGAGTPGFGTNSPAATPGSVYTWLKVTTNDGSTGYIPVWK